VNFIHNEASDYEIMSLLMTGKLPDEKYSMVGEMQLFSLLKEQMMRQSGLLTELVGEEIFNNVIQEVDSVFPLLSTAKPIVEFMSMQDQEIALSYTLNEAMVGGNVGTTAGTALQTGVQHAKAAGGAVKGALATAGKFWAQKYAALKAAIMGGPGGPGAIAKISTFAASPAGMALGGAAAAALVGYAAAKIYKRFFSQAAKACGGLSGSAKTTCMNKYKKQALMKQAATVQQGASVCAKVKKNPEKCKAGVAKKVAAIKAKAAKIAG
jgi:hypothetical protein